MRQTRVVLTGFMGAGKTTVGHALARLLAVAFLDLDDAVAESEGRGPRELIDDAGEDYFRAAETRALRRELEGGAARVIATGGGAWTLERNRALVREHGCLAVWLDAPFALCQQRIEQSGGPSDRPFARDPARARELYESRLAAYRTADLRVRVAPESSPDELAAEIAGALGAKID